MTLAPPCRTCVGKGAATLIQFSSVDGLAAYPYVSIYNATKWAMEGFYESLAREVTGFGIATTLMEPGGFRTDAHSRSAVHTPVLPEYAELREKLLSRFPNPSATRYGSPPP